MPLSQQAALATLEHVSQLAIKGNKLMRYKGNPHVSNKDSVLAHKARIVMLASDVLPLLRKEFADQPEILEELHHLQTIVCLHDDEEILKDDETATFAKQHDKDNAAEVALVKSSVVALTPEQREYIVGCFATFRQRKTLTGPKKLVADIAKVLDNLVGNQLAIEDEIGLIQPDYAIACLNYVREYRGQVCQTIDALIDAQLAQMLTLRERMTTDGSAERLAMLWAGEQRGRYEDLLLAIHTQLAVNLDTHTFDKAKCYTAIWEYK